MGHSTRPRISPEDIKLFQSISKHGFVDVPYVIRFIYKGNCKETILARIRQLKKYKYLATLDTFIPPEWVIDMQTGYRIITLGTAGLRLMRMKGVDVISNIHALKAAQPYRMYHQVQVATVCDSLVQNYALDISKWQVHKVLSERDTFVQGAGNQPDAVIIFKPKNQDTQAYVAIFIELERSYASEKSVLRKLRSYEANILDGTFKRKLQLPIIKQRVLFVSQTRGQFEHIRSKIQLTDAGKKIDILVSSYQAVCNKSLEAIYIETQGNHKVKLLEKNIKQAKAEEKKSKGV